MLQKTHFYRKPKFYVLVVTKQKNQQLLISKYSPQRDQQGINQSANFS